MEPYHNLIKAADNYKWDPKKETIKVVRWKPIRALSKGLITINRTPKEKLLKMLYGTLSKHIMTSNRTPKRKTRLIVPLIDTPAAKKNDPFHIIKVDCFCYYRE